MRAGHRDQPVRGRGRRRARLLTWAALVLSLLTGAALALQGRRPALPAFVEQRRLSRGAGPGTRPVGPTAEGEPTSEPASEPALGSTAEPVASPVEPVASGVEPFVQPVDEPSAGSAPEPAPEPGAEPGAEPAPLPTSRRAAPGGGLSQLVRVSGLGRRSAEALVLAGIASLEDLAASDAASLGAALDAAGVKRSATLATWPRQAEKLLEQ